MDQPNTSNTNNTQNNRRASRKSAKRVLIIAVVLLVVIGALALTLFLTSRKSQPSPELTVDTHSMQSDRPSMPENPDQKPAQPPATGTVITTDQSKFGTMLFNGNKQAIYIWQREDSLEPKCYDSCAAAWPPVLTEGEPQAAGEVSSKLLGTTKRSDGSTQVTYNGHPLYYYAHEGPGEVECHNISTHGGLWWVIQPNGNRAV